MPEYCRHCPACELRFSVCVPMREATAIRCPKCSGVVDLDLAAQGVPGRNTMEFHGSAQISPELRISPREVQQARRDFGDDGAAHCWQDDGRVKFTHMSDANKFFGKLKTIRARVKEFEAEHPTPKIPRGKRTGEVQIATVG